jgi:glucose-6-phosphate dehydrogenase-like protein OpcA
VVDRVNDGVVIGSWTARDTDVGTVDAAIRRLRAGHERGALRTAVWTVIALVDDDETQTDQVVDVVRELAVGVAINPLVISALADEAPGIDVRVTVRAVERSEGDTDCVEDIAIRVRGAATQHLDSVVLPFTVPGLPVAVWLPGRLPRQDEPLPSKADLVLVETARPGGAPPLAEVRATSRWFPLSDLSWLRQESWRQVLSSLFVGREFSQFLDDVQRIDVEGDTGFRLLMAGWLMSRLMMPPDACHLAGTDTPGASVQLRARHGSRSARFEAVQRSDGPRVDAYAAIDDGPAYHRTVLMPTYSVARLIDRALSGPVHDLVWEEAVAAAVELTGRPPGRG